MKENIEIQPNEKQSSEGIYQINKPLKLNTVHEGEPNDNILVYGTDNEVRSVPRSEFFEELITGTPNNIPKIKIDGTGIENSCIVDYADKVLINKKTEIVSGIENNSGLTLTNLKNEKNEITTAQANHYGTGLFKGLTYIYSISSFGDSINRISKDLVSIPIVGFPSNGIISIVEHPNLDLYACSTNGYIYKITPDNVISVESYIPGNDYRSMAINGENIFLGCANSYRVVKYNISSNTISNLTIFNPGDCRNLNMKYLDGFLYVISGENMRYPLYKIDVTDGSYTPYGDIIAEDSAFLQFDDEGGFIFNTRIGLDIYKIDSSGNQNIFYTYPNGTNTLGSRIYFTDNTLFISNPLENSVSRVYSDGTRDILPNYLDFATGIFAENKDEFFFATIKTINRYKKKLPKSYPLTTNENGDIIFSYENYVTSDELPVQPKKYKALLTQDGTSAPLTRVIVNELGGNVILSYNSVGIYIY